MPRATELFGSFITLLLAAACAPSPSDAPPNLILLIADDLGRTDVGFVSEPGGTSGRAASATPSIDRIANEGVELRNLYAHPVCSLTRAALLTGREPGRLGLVSVVRPWEDRGLPADSSTLAEVLRDRGYATALIGKWHLGHARRSQWPQAHGFDYFYGSLRGAIDYFTHERLGGLDWQRNGETLHETGYATDLVRDDALRWLGEQNGPYFMMLAFNAPHPPRQAPTEALARHAGKPRGEQLLAAMIDSLDDAIGAVLDEVEQRGELDNTIIVFLSDNGAGSATRTGGLRGDKGTVYEGGLRVPAAIRGPGLPAGPSSQRMNVEDLFATLGDALGVELPANVDGQSLWPELQGGSERERAALFFAADSRDERGRALLAENWKLVQEFEDGGWRSELFDIRTDASESLDVSSTRPKVEAALRKRLAAWYEAELGAPSRLPAEAPGGWKPPRDVASAALP